MVGGTQGKLPCLRSANPHDADDLPLLYSFFYIIGADGVHVGTVDKVEGDRIKLIKADSGSHDDHHHYVSGGLVAEVEGDTVRLSANGASAVLLEEEESGRAIMDDDA